MTELKNDLSLIEDPNAKEHPAYPAFCKEMEGRAYDSEPLNDAWVWFRDGWDAGWENCDSLGGRA